MDVKRRRKRLVVLADWLENDVLPMLDGAKFDMARWGMTRKKDITKTQFNKLNLAKASECGYQGCAIGWGLLSPQLRKAGIGGVVENRWSFDEDGVLNEVDVDSRKIEDFFGINYDQLEKAFCGPGKGRRGIVAVAKKLRKIAEEPVETEPAW